MQKVKLDVCSAAKMCQLQLIDHFFFKRVTIVLIHEYDFNVSVISFLITFGLFLFSFIAHSCAEVTQQARALVTSREKAQKPSEEKKRRDIYLYIYINKNNSYLQIEQRASPQTCPTRRQQSGRIAWTRKGEL